MYFTQNLKFFKVIIKKKIQVKFKKKTKIEKNSKITNILPNTNRNKIPKKMETDLWRKTTRVSGAEFSGLRIFKDQIYSTLKETKQTKREFCRFFIFRWWETTFLLRLLVCCMVYNVGNYLCISYLEDILDLFGTHCCHIVNFEFTG